MACIFYNMPYVFFGIKYVFRDNVSKHKNKTFFFFRKNVIFMITSRAKSVAMMLLLPIIRPVILALSIS